MAQLKEPTIKKINCRKIFDSRGNPTIEVEVKSQKEGDKDVYTGRAAAPSGASTGIHEVVAFPVGGVDSSIKEIKKITPKLLGKSVIDQEELDRKCRELDGTLNLSKIGGNAIVALSMAAAKSAASANGVPLYKYLGGDKSNLLPFPLGNVLGGGEHAGSSTPDIQEFLVLPLGAENFQEAALGNAQVHERVKKRLSREDGGFTGGKGDEGAWAPNLSNSEALEIVTEACEEVSGETGLKMKAGLDVAASSLYNPKKKIYEYPREKNTRDTEEQIEFMTDLIKTYDLSYVEDPIQEDDFESFAKITNKAGSKCLICGDDAFVTNAERIKKGMEIGAANAVLIKPNQIGTLSDTKKAVQITEENKCTPVISHRSGETPDETIAHMAVGFGCPVIKTGVVGGERVAKLNELIRIEEELGENARMNVIE